MAQSVIKVLTDTKVTLRKLTPKERLVGEGVLTNNLGIKTDEHVVIVTDAKRVESEAPIFFEAAKKLSKNITLVVTEPARENAEEPEKEVEELMKKADALLLVTTYSLTHTQAVEQARRQNARVASMPGITHDVIMRTLSINYNQVAKLSKRIASVLTKGTNALLTSRNGTNVVFNLSGRTAMADTGLITNPGDWGNLPAGEAFIAPREGKSEGVVVFDGAFADLSIDQPITVTIKKGQAVDIKGGQGARILNERLSRVGKHGYNVAELGVGTNKKARLDSILLEVEKIYQTVHVALGNNAYFGGEVDAPFHADGVILKPTLKVDDTVILEDGIFKL